MTEYKHCNKYRKMKHVPLDDIIFRLDQVFGLVCEGTLDL